jgi:thiol-disulfide isomerase/thioredoxin
MGYNRFKGHFLGKGTVLFVTFFVTISSPLWAQKVSVIDYNSLEKILETRSDSAKIINLWATWCQPCLEELPYFVNEQKQWHGKPVTFIFVSLDFPSQEEKVKQKATDLKLPGAVLQLEEKGNEWIDRLDKNWSGAIPYTILILPGGNRIEHYDAFSSLQQLDSFLSKNLTP